MAEDMSDLALDGNAAASRLQQFFVPEITGAQIDCEACGYAAALATLRLYGGEMGAVLRCPRCDGLVMRAVHTAHGSWLEMRGTRYLRFSLPE